MLQNVHQRVRVYDMRAYVNVSRVLNPSRSCIEKNAQVRLRRLFDALVASRNARVAMCLRDEKPGHHESAEPGMKDAVARAVLCLEREDVCGGLDVWTPVEWNNESTIVRELSPGFMAFFDGEDVVRHARTPLLACMHATSCTPRAVRVEFYLPPADGSEHLPPADGSEHGGQERIELGWVKVSG
jgi:hypothetical protein